MLADVSLSVGPDDRIGVVGPNGVGKSTLLQLLAGVVSPDRGRISLDPATATVGYLAQEHETPPGETVKQTLARRTGCHAAEVELAQAAADLSLGARQAEHRYDAALERFTALGVADLEAELNRRCSMWV